MVEDFLEKHPEYHLKEFKIEHNSFKRGFGQKYRSCVRIDPREMQSDGFFVAVFTRGGLKPNNI